MRKKIVGDEAAKVVFMDTRVRFEPWITARRYSYNKHTDKVKQASAVKSEWREEALFVVAWRAPTGRRCGRDEAGATASRRSIIRQERTIAGCPQGASEMNRPPSGCCGCR
jgi:hypothetical protein